MARNTRVLRWLAALLCACLVLTNFAGGGLSVARAYDPSGNKTVENVYQQSNNTGPDGQPMGKRSTDQLTLLAGDAEELKGKNLQETINNYQDMYLLGVAADFCVFLQKSFTVYGSDAEGRVAVGGDIVINVPDGSYAIGAGDYTNVVPLDTLLVNRNGAATIILGGEITSTATTSNNDHKLSDIYYDENKLKYENANLNEWTNSTNYRDAAHKSTKILVLNHDRPNGDNSWVPDWLKKSGYDKALPQAVPYNNNWIDPWPKVDQSQTYVTQLLDFSTLFPWLNAIGSKLPVQQALTQLAKDTSVKYESNTFTFTYEGSETIQECVYFTLTESDFKDFQKAENIKFEKIPKLPEPRTVMGNDGHETTWDYAYIIVNVEYTGIEGSEVKQNLTRGSSNTNTLLENRLDDNKKYIFIETQAAHSKVTTINGKSITVGRDNAENNDPGVTSILYNFDKTDSNSIIVLGGNFQGTIFAPNAHVTDEAYLSNRMDAQNDWNMRGHLSGALIAQSFEGTTEFGYRPFSALTRQIFGSGNLVVAKTVAGEGADKDRSFEFEVKLTIGNPPTPIKDETFGVLVTDAEDEEVAGAITELSFTNGVAKFALKDGQKLAIRDLTAGWTYEVKEISVEGYEVSNKVTGKIGETISGTIESGKVKEETFLNTYTTVRRYGNLTVTKSVTGEGADKTKAFRFMVKVEPKLNDKYGDMIFENGVASFTLKDGEKKSALGLPEGTSYTVTELDADGYFTSATDDEGKIVADKTVTAKFVNQKIADKSGNLTVNKTVTGKGGSQTQSFNFTVTLGDRTVTGKYGDMVFTNGVAKFSLKHGEEKSAIGLPDGVAYTVTEDSAKDYKISQKGEKGVIMNGQTQITVFVNAYVGADGSEGSEVPKTGDGFPMQLWLGLMALAMVGLCVAARKSRRS